MNMHKKLVLTFVRATLLGVLLVIGGESLPFLHAPAFAAQAPVPVRPVLQAGAPRPPASVPAQQPVPAGPVEGGANAITNDAPAAAACSNEVQTATLARKDDIVAVNRLGATQYTQFTYGWSGSSLALDSGVGDFDAISRNRMLEIVQRSGGALYHDWVTPDSPLAGRVRSGQASLGNPNGQSFTGRPALVERTPFEMWLVARAANNTLWYKVWKNPTGLPDGTKWTPGWSAIPNVSNAGSNPAIVFRDTNHLEVLYKDGSGKAWFIEWAFGEWMPAAVDLKGSFTSDLTAVSMNDNHVAVFATDANSGLYVRQWTADKSPDWSDATDWTKPFTGMQALKPAAAALNGNAMAIAMVGTNGWLYVADYTPSGWSGQVALGTVTSTPTLTKLNANTLAVSAIKNGGDAATYIRQGNTWGPQQVPGGGLAAGKSPVLVTWEPGEAALFGLNGSASLLGFSYTSYQRTPTWNNVVSFTPMPIALPAQDRYVLVHKNSTPYLVWLERDNLGRVSVRSRANPLTSAVTGSIVLPQTDIDGISMIGKDMLADGNEEVVIALMTKSKQVFLYVMNPDGLSLAIQAGPGAVRNASYTGFMAMDAGDLDGDGRKNEIALTFRGGADTYVRQTIEIYRLDGSALTYVTSSENAFGAGWAFQSLSLVIDRFDNSAQDVIATGYVVVNGNSSPDKTVAGAGMWRLVPLAAPQTGFEIRHLGGTIYAKRSTVIWGSIDLAAADLDGDGTRELAAAVFLPGSSSELYVSALRGATMPQIGYVGDVNGPGPRISVGDLDGDGKQEIAGAYNNTVVYKQQAGATVGTLTVVRKDPTLLKDADFFVGDVNNDSVTVVNDGCEDFRELRVEQVLNAPPRWYNDSTAGVSQGGGAGFGKSSSSGSSVGSTTSSSGGGSVSLGVQIEGRIPLIGVRVAESRASITQDFTIAKTQSREDAVTDTWSTNYGFDTGDNGNGQKGLVVYSQTKFRCYFYREKDEPAGTRSLKVCAHLGVGTSGKPQVTKVSLEQWRDPKFKSSAGSSWADVGAPTNLMTGPNGYLTKNRIPANHFPIVKEFPDAEYVQGDVFPTATEVEWDNTTDTTTGTEKSWETNTTISAGVTAGIVTVDVSGTFGFGGSSTSSTTIGTGQTYAALLYNYDPSACQIAKVNCTDYTVKPYIYLHTIKTLAGETYPVNELDYYVPQVLSTMTVKSSRKLPASRAPSIVPEVPVISSPTHPDPNAWYDSNTVTLNWNQPDGDHAQVVGYDWLIDPDPTDVPSGFKAEPVQTVTYTDVDEGSNFFTVLAKNDVGQSSAVATRQVLVDTKPPTVELILSHVNPVEGWYHEPLSVAVAADDDVGSGIASREYRINGGAWQAFTAPIEFNSNTGPVTLEARATDHAGHVSEIASTTFEIDLLPPVSTLTYLRHITTDTGVSEIVLGGSLGDDLSGIEGMELSIAETDDYFGAQQIGVFPMPPGNELATSDTTVNWIYTDRVSARGSYHIMGFGSDVAGNDEAAHDLGTFVWEPTGAPDYSETVISSDENGLYGGEEGTFVIAVRNIGTEESNLLVTATIPTGLSVVPDSISDGGQRSGNKIVWHDGTAWADSTRYLTFRAHADLSPDVPTPLTLSVLLHPYYADALDVIADPPELTVHGTVTILPGSWGPAVGEHLPTPHVSVAFVEQGSLVTQRDVDVFIEASEDARYLYVREYKLASNGTWRLAQESGWLPFETTSGLLTVEDTTEDREGVLKWKLSSGDGVKMLELRAANANNQVSSANDGDIIYTSLMSSGGSSLAAGEIAQYRVHLRHSGEVTWSLNASSGTGDLNLWAPRMGHQPLYTSSNGVLHFTPEEDGVYILEVHANSDLVYQLAASGDVELQGGAQVAGKKAGVKVKPRTGKKQVRTLSGIPDHPLTLSIPIVEALHLPPIPGFIFLPLVQVKAP